MARPENAPVAICGARFLDHGTKKPRADAVHDLGVPRRRSASEWDYEIRAFRFVIPVEAKKSARENLPEGVAFFLQDFRVQDVCHIDLSLFQLTIPKEVFGIPGGFGTVYFNSYPFLAIPKTIVHPAVNIWLITLEIS